MGEHRAIRYTQRDIERAVKGMRKAGVTDGEVRIDAAGNIRILFGDAAKQASESEKGWGDFE